MILDGVITVTCVIALNSVALAASYVKVAVTKMWSKESSFQQYRIYGNIRRDYRERVH